MKHQPSRTFSILCSRAWPETVTVTVEAPDLNRAIEKAIDDCIDSPYWSDGECTGEVFIDAACEGNCENVDAAPSKLGIPAKYTIRDPEREVLRDFIHALQTLFGDQLDAPAELRFETLPHDDPHTGTIRIEISPESADTPPGQT